MPLSADLPFKRFQWENVSKLSSNVCKIGKNCLNKFRAIYKVQECFNNHFNSSYKFNLYGHLTLAVGSYFTSSTVFNSFCLCWRETKLSPLNIFGLKHNQDIHIAIKTLRSWQVWRICLPRNSAKSFFILRLAWSRNSGCPYV